MIAMDTSTPEGEGRENRGPLTLAAIWVLTGLASLVVIARLYVRQWVLQSTGIDDWLIGIAMVSAPVLSIAHIIKVALN